MIIVQERGMPQAFNNIFQGVSPHLHLTLQRSDWLMLAWLGSWWTDWWHFERFVCHLSLTVLVCSNEGSNNNGDLDGALHFCVRYRSLR